MAVRALDKAKFEFLQKYSNSELYTLIFTDYKKYPTELVKIGDLETLARTKISQIINVLGIVQVTTLKDFFETVNQVRQQVEAVPADELAAIEALVDSAGSISEQDAAFANAAQGAGGG